MDLSKEVQAQIADLYGDLSGEFYSYTYGGKERYLYSLNGNYTALEIDENYLLYTNFCLDEDYRLVYVEYDDFFAYLGNNNKLLLSMEEDYISHSIEFNKDLIVHYQYNVKTDEKLFMTYQYNYQERQSIYEGLLKEPFIIQFINNKDTEQYIRIMFKQGYLSYDLLTIREFGLLKFMKQGSFVLQNKKTINRYFKTLKQFSNGVCMTLWGVTKPSTLRSIKDKIKEKGFYTEIPTYVLNYYNDHEIEEFKMLASAIKSRVIKY